VGGQIGGTARCNNRAGVRHELPRVPGIRRHGRQPDRHPFGQRIRSTFAVGGTRNDEICRVKKARDPVATSKPVEVAQVGQALGAERGTMIASSSIDSTVDFGSRAPVGRSATEPRFFQLATVFRLIP
jgi:hypothetical protein